MKKSSLRNAIIAIATGVAMMSFVALPGGEFYRITLNGKQVVEQFLTRSTKVPTLELPGNATKNQLSVFYSHCGKTGTGRSLSLKSNDQVLKKWNFNNSAESMMLDVSDLVKSVKQCKAIELVYRANEMEKDMVLAKVEIIPPVTASRQ